MAEIDKKISEYTKIALDFAEKSSKNGYESPDAYYKDKEKVLSYKKMLMQEINYEGEIQMRRIEYPELKKNGVTEEALRAYLDKGYVFYWEQQQIHCAKMEPLGRFKSFDDVNQFLQNEDMSLINMEPLPEREFELPDSKSVLEGERSRIRSTYLSFRDNEAQNERKSLDALQEEINQTRSNVKENLHGTDMKSRQER